ncbi:MAG: hypothetical protein GWM90_03195 [Gemmatimonadetes bacterium]|nr:hypothetical protein [Gemmatimonadota bacterium]NIQ52623.1 hypothetical protein [Gemmatimonadota bacterium]NIU76539.1 hypothetical protein [Gammaproteobacteria bacterium]NIX43161.1 hypothetical protein [Gemmatimonadota bacterium]NIY07327.1 hypothetical protein [Gemmatimonadota bacterium]
MAVGDRITTADEDGPGTPLLEPVMENGARLPAAERTLDEARDHAARSVARMPDRIRAIEAADEPYPVTVSDELERRQQAIVDALRD